MIRTAMLATLLPLPALAHPGHWGTLAGHDHWIALGALGVAGALAAAALVRSRRRRARKKKKDPSGAKA